MISLLSKTALFYVALLCFSWYQMLSKMHSKASKPSWNRTKMPGTIVFLLSVRPCSNNALQLPAHRTAAHIPLHNGRSQSFVCAPGAGVVFFFILKGTISKRVKFFLNHFEKKPLRNRFREKRLNRAEQMPRLGCPETLLCTEEFRMNFARSRS